MNKILLVTHGNFCEGIKDSVNVILGHSDMIETISIGSSTSREDVELQFRDFIMRNNESVCVVITDIIAGSTSQFSIDFFKSYPEVFILSGLNLGLLLELSIMSEINRDTLKETIDVSKHQITILNDISSNLNDDEI